MAGDDDHPLREPIHNDVHPILVQPGRVRRRLRRWQLLAVGSLAALVATVAWMVFAPEPRLATASPAAAFQAADDPDKLRHATEQVKAENALLRKALAAADEVAGYHRHHSQKMWDMLAGRISSKEAWWQGGDSTCSGWVAAGEYEVAVGKLKGREVKAPPVPAEGLEFCKQARERR
jgi:hypothetical protein